MRHAIRPIMFVGLVGLAAAGCARPADKAAAPTSFTSADLDQKWDAATSGHYWWTSQGSQIVPYAYFTALELKDSQELFISNAHFERLRMITVSGKSATNPDGLPIGFVRNQAKVNGLDVMGVTCAACHSAKWKIGGTDVMVEGGPSKGDFQTFFFELIDSVTQTLGESDKFDRFAKRVGGDAAGLKAGLQTWLTRLEARNTRNPIPTPSLPGYGRDDALSKIMNEIASGDLGVAGNARPANAPVSFPAVWDAPQHDVVQWNGSIPNAGAGPALRNIGEVLGVFGTVEIQPSHGKLPNYPNSTAETKNLNALEQDLWALSSPLWPEKLVPLDKPLAEAGKPLFEQHCASCHLPIDRTNPSRRIVAQMRDVGTDSTLTRNVARVVNTGKLKGMPKMVNPLEVFGEQASAIDVLMNTVFGAYLAHWRDFSLAPAVARDEARGTGKLPTLGSLFEALEGDAKQAVADFHGVAAIAEQAFKLTGNTQSAPTNLYKARPLNGVWATGPYLHNGSVPSLAELLKPDSDRVQEFYVGSWVFDPVNVGITSVPEEGGIGMFLFKTSSVGNSNAGHNFGTTLTAQQKRQLIEYLKSL